MLFNLKYPTIIALRELKFTVKEKKNKDIRTHRKVSFFIHLTKLAAVFLFQTSNGFIYFSDVLWPEFSKYHFLKAVLYYQCHAKKEIKQNISQFGDDEESYLEHMKRKTKYSLLSYCIEMNFFPADTNLNKLYSYDYETIYDCFKLSYKVGDWFI